MSRSSLLAGFALVLAAALALSRSAAGAENEAELSVQVRGRAAPHLVREPRPTCDGLTGLERELALGERLLLLRDDGAVCRGVALRDLLSLAADDGGDLRIVLRDGRRLRGRCLTGLEGKTADGWLEVGAEQIESAFWLSLPEPAADTTSLLRDVWSATSAASLRVRERSVSSGDATETELDGFCLVLEPRDASARCRYSQWLELGCGDAWRTTVDLTRVQSIAFEAAAGAGLTASARLPGLAPLRGRARLPEPDDASAATPTDARPVLLGQRAALVSVYALESVEELRPKAPALPDVAAWCEAHDRWDVTALCANSAEAFCLRNVEPSYRGSDRLLQWFTSAGRGLVLARPAGEQVAVQPEHVRRLVRGADGDFLAVLNDGSPVDGTLLTDIQGDSPYGRTWIAAASVALASSAAPAAAPPASDGAAAFTAVVRRSDGAVRRLADPQWLGVPRPGARDPRCRVTEQICLVGPGWSDGFELARVLEAAWDPSAGDGGRACHVKTEDARGWHGELAVSAAASPAELYERLADHAPWLTGRDGPLLAAIPLAAIELVVIDAPRAPSSFTPNAQVVVDGASPPERELADVRPVVYRPTAALLQYVSLEDHCVLLEERDEPLYTAIPLSLVESIERQDSELVRVLVGIRDAFPAGPRSGRLVGGLEGRTAFGYSQVDPSRIRSYRPVGAAVDAAAPTLQELRTGLRFDVRTRGGRSLVLFHCFVADEFLEGGERRFAPVDALRIGGGSDGELDLDLRALASLELEWRASAQGGRALSASARTSGSTVPVAGALLLRESASPDTRWGPPDPGDMLCGWNAGLLACVPITAVARISQ